jgi:hypothetical protein
MHSDQVSGRYRGIPAYTELNHLPYFLGQSRFRVIALGDNDAGSARGIFRLGEERFEGGMGGLQVSRFIVRHAPARFVGDYSGD